MSARRLVIFGLVSLLFASGANGARYQRTKDGKTIVWNSLRGVAQDATWSGLRDLNGYATGEGTLTWSRFGSFVNSYTGKMVHGKFEGPVIRIQGNTRLQATFANGDKVNNWLEPGSTAGPTPTAAPTESPKTEVEPEEEPLSSSPSPTPVRTPRSTPTPTPKPTPSPTRTPFPTPKLTPVPTALPTSTPIATPSLTPPPRPSSTVSTTATAAPSLSPSPIEQTGKKDVFPLEGQVPELQGLEFAAPSSAPTKPPQEMRRPETSPTSSTSAGPRQGNANLKLQMIADLKNQTQSVLAQVSAATGNFREIEQLEQVQALPAAIATKVTLLGNQAHEFRARVGYEVTYYECLTEIETIDALVVVDEVTRDLAAKDAPAARQMLVPFVKRYSKPSVDDLKPLWRYLNSAASLCNQLKNDAATHLPRARSFELSGKKNEALAEYREIYRIYPNPITADKIKQLENKPR